MEITLESLMCYVFLIKMFAGTLSFIVSNNNKNYSNLHAKTNAYINLFSWLSSTPYLGALGTASLSS